MFKTLVIIGLSVSAVTAKPCVGGLMVGLAAPVIAGKVLAEIGSLAHGLAAGGQASGNVTADGQASGCVTGGGHVSGGVAGDAGIHLGLPGVAELDLSKGDDGMGIGFETILNHGVRARVDGDGVGVNIGRTGHHTIDAEIGQKGATIGLEGHGLELKNHIGLDGADIAVGLVGAPIGAHIGFDGASIGIGGHQLKLPNLFNLSG